MNKTTLMHDELEALILETLRQNTLTADISAVEIAVQPHDVDSAIADRHRSGLDWTVVRARRGGQPFFDGALDTPTFAEDHGVDADDAAVRRALDEIVSSLRARYTVLP